MSTPQAVWMTMNQFQLILLLFLSGAFIPKMVEDYLKSMRLTTCSLNFIPFKDIPYIKEVIKYLDFVQVNDELDKFGIFSGSAIVNNFSLF